MSSASVETPLPDSRSQDAGERLRFETFLSDVAARLLDAQPEDLDDAIQASVVELGAYLGSERGGVGLFSEDGRSLFYKYGYFAPEASTLFYETDLARALPWYVSQVRAGRMMVLRKPLEDLPPEAEAERQAVAALGLKSGVLLPLRAGGQVLGALGVDHLNTPCSWPPELLSRLELLAGVYAQALYRGRARQRLRRTHDLNRSVLASDRPPFARTKRTARAFSVADHSATPGSMLKIGASESKERCSASLQLPRSTILRARAAWRRHAATARSRSPAKRFSTKRVCRVPIRPWFTASHAPPERSR